MVTERTVNINDLPLVNGKRDVTAQLFTALCIETVNACNRKCWFCKYGQPREQETIRFMSWDMITKIIYNLRDLNYTGRVSWYKINEPLMDKRIYNILELTKEHVPNCWLTLVTNGDLLTDDLYRKLKVSGLDFLAVSIYDDKAMEKAKCLKGDKGMVLWDQRSDRQKNFVENRGGNIILKEHLKQTTGNGFYLNLDCARPSTMINIQSDGKVSLCCADMWCDVVMGNINEATLEDVWFGEKFEAYRRHLRNQGRNGLKLCESCTHNGSGHPKYFGGIPTI